ncbi:MAG: SPFH domain-containing protein [Phycisphaerae bacterium]
MRRHIGLIVLAAVVVLALLASMVAFTVETTEIVLVKTFGETTRVYYGSEPAEVQGDDSQPEATALAGQQGALTRTADAGLHFRWPYPIQSIVRYDARTFVFEDPVDEVQTQDKNPILLTMSCTWRIEDPERFYESVRTIDAAERSIRSLLRSRKRDVVGQHPFADFVNTDPEEMKLREIAQDEILPRLRQQAADLYGVRIESLGIKSLNIPEGATAKVIDAMREERTAAAETYRARGQAWATAIRERARAARDQITAFAERKAQDIRTEGDRAAAEYYRQFAENPQLSAFLRYLQSLREELSERTVIVLDGTSLPSVDFFRNAPTTESLKLPSPLQMPLESDAAGEAAPDGQESEDE